MKTLPAGATTALAAGQYAVRALVLFDLPSGRYGLFDDAYDIVYLGDTYIGAAGRFTLQIPPGAADLSIRGLTVTLSALDNAALAWVQTQEYHQRPMHASLAILAPSEPQTLHVRRWFTGVIDQVIWHERIDGQARLIIKCESASRELDRAGARTRSDADQRAIDPADGFFKETLNSMAAEIEWGRLPPAAPQKKKWWDIF